jgi:hypothetical protein
MSFSLLGPMRPNKRVKNLKFFMIYFFIFIELFFFEKKNIKSARSAIKKQQ